MLNVQCPSCGHYDSYKSISSAPMKCTYCKDWYAVTDVTSYSTKHLKSDKAMSLLVELSNKGEV